MFSPKLLLWLAESKCFFGRKSPKASPFYLPGCLRWAPFVEWEWLNHDLWGQKSHHGNWVVIFWCSALICLTHSEWGRPPCNNIFWLCSLRPRGLGFQSNPQPHWSDSGGLLRSWRPSCWSLCSVLPLYKNSDQGCDQHSFSPRSLRDPLDSVKCVWFAHFEVIFQIQLHPRELWLHLCTYHSGCRGL